MAVVSGLLRIVNSRSGWQLHVQYYVRHTSNQLQEESISIWLVFGFHIGKNSHYCIV